MTIIFFLLFAILLFSFYTNLDTLKHNPCELCVEHYDLTCNDGKGLVLYKGFDWDDDEKLRDLQQEVNSEYAELYERMNKINVSKVA